MKIKLNNNFWPSFWIIIALGIVLLIGSSCSCNYLLKKAANKCGKTQSDTLIIHDTIRFDMVRTDTVFSSKIGDTITITKDRLQIKYVKLPGDSVYINGSCDSIFVNRFIKVPYEKTVIKYSWWQELLDKVGLALLIVIIIAAIYAVKKIFF